LIANIGSLQHNQALAAQAGLPKPLTKEESDLKKAQAAKAMADAAQAGLPKPLTKEESDLKKAQAAKAMADAAQVGKPKPLTPEASAHLKAQTDLANSQADLNDQKVQDLRDYGPKEMDPGQLQKSLNAVERQRPIIGDVKANNARDVLLGTRPRDSAAGQWLQKTEVSGFVKRREKLIESQIVEQQKLDTMQANPGHFSNTPTQISQQQRKVDFYQKQIDSVNAEMRKYEPAEMVADRAAEEASTASAQSAAFGPPLKATTDTNNDMISVLAPPNASGHRVRGKVSKSDLQKALKQGYSTIQ
jgi:hypothetical protein